MRIFGAAIVIADLLYNYNKCTKGGCYCGNGDDDAYCDNEDGCLGHAIATMRVLAIRTYSVLPEFKMIFNF